MVDPNRKINLENNSDEDDLNDEHIEMIKEYEEEFKDRFTERDEVWTKFCATKPKPPIVVYPFDVYHHHHRGGGGGGGGRFNNRGHNYHYNRNQYDNRRNFNYQNNNRFNNKRSHDESGGYDDTKRFRRDEN